MNPQPQLYYKSNIAIKDKKTVPDTCLDVKLTTVMVAN